VLANEALSCSDRALALDVRLGKPRGANIARICAFLAVTAFAGASETARAEGRPDIPVRVTEDLHEGCPRSPTMLVRVRARLARVRPAAEGEPAVDVDVRVERRDGLSLGTVALVGEGERAERTASSASCERVLAALAVMAAIGLDEGDVPVSPAPAPAPAPAPGASATVPTAPAAELPPVAPLPRTGSQPKTAPEPAPAPRVPRPLHFGVAVGTSLEASANRGAVLTPAVFGQIAFPLRFEPFLRLGFAQSFREKAVSALGSASLEWTEATVAGCGDLVRHATLRAGPCVNAEAGALEAVVVEPLPSRGRSRLWLSAGASARVAWRPLRALSFEVAFGARVPLIRNQLFFEPLTLVYEAPFVVPFVGTAVLAHLP
jgi:hypothetical protein